MRDAVALQVARQEREAVLVLVRGRDSDWEEEGVGVWRRERVQVWERVGLQVSDGAEGLRLWDLLLEPVPEGERKPVLVKVCEGVEVDVHVAGDGLRVSGTLLDTLGVQVQEEDGVGLRVRRGLRVGEGVREGL